ncbi:hypothetical protein LIER_38906 [Lithospermum erythrorhizon]|uniref:Protein FAR1-RELATED SEQUENCE n=1 Tax=Lithospermum erythrorhizon TaxID=34254 RepID=A0AAV3QAY3_LITER
MLDNMREKHNNSEHKSIQFLPDIKFQYSSIVKQAAKQYTPRLFSLFQEQYALLQEYFIDLNDATSCLVRKVYFVFKLDPKDSNIKLDVVDILRSCGRYPDLRCILDKYVLKRWTRTAMSDFQSWIVPEKEGSRPSTYTIKYQEYCSAMMRIGNRICMNDDVYYLFMKDVGEALSKAEECITGQPHPRGQSAKGIKRKHNPNKSRKRLIPTRELAMDRLNVSRQKKRSEEEELLMPLKSALQEDDIIE